MYFNKCLNLIELKKLFRKLCCKLHPDQSGDNKEFIKMYKEYEEACKTFGGVKGQQEIKQDSIFKESVVIFDKKTEKIRKKHANLVEQVHNLVLENKADIKVLRQEIKDLFVSTVLSKISKDGAVEIF